MAIFWVQFILGVWVLISPWVLGFADITLMKWGNLLVGTAMVLINARAIFGDKAESEKVGQ